MFGLSEADLDIIRALPSRYPNIERILIFGSRALGNFRPYSDVDLAIKGKLKPQEIWRIASDLNDEGPSPYKYDVVGLNLIENPRLLSHIEKYGIEVE